MKKRRPIKGTPTPKPIPLDPNDLAPECIRVDKVYDWVFFSNRYENKNFIPDEGCRTAVNEALIAGEDVDVTCTPPDSKDVICNATIVKNGNPGKVAIVWTVPVQVTVRINGSNVCTFTVRTQFDDEIMLCVPEGITDDNINCRATDVLCRSNRPLMGPDPFGPMVPLKVLLCKEVQVEFPVKLEVLAKFCFPRPDDIPKPPDMLECPLDAFEFPPQCPDIFPPNNCECQATALAKKEETLATFGTDGTMITGLSTLEAEICQECALADSEFSYSFKDTDDDENGPTPTPSPNDFSFTFDPTSIESAECDIEGESVTVFGEGQRFFNGIPEHVFYELRIFNSPESFQLILRNGAGTQVFDSGIVDALVRYSECDTFADLLNNNDNNNG
ncbi:BMQ_0737 family morphogenetic spore coat protein [Salibacterium sp. K-3]